MFLCLHFFCMIVSYLNNDIFSYHSEAQNILHNVYLQEPILNILKDTKMLCPIRFVFCHHTPDPQQSIRILICKCKMISCNTKSGFKYINFFVIFNLIFKFFLTLTDSFNAKRFGLWTIWVGGQTSIC